MNYKAQEEKDEKLIQTLEAYRSLKNEVSGIRELSKRLGKGFSKSTLQRYFHQLYERHLIDEKEYEEIQLWLKENIKKGNSNGGFATVEKYEHSRDEKGRYKGEFVNVKR